MTNRERIEAMTDEQLATLICSGIDGTSCCAGRCKGGTCADCMVEWLRSDDKPKKGDVRKIGDNYYMVVRVHESESKLMWSDGTFEWITNDFFHTDEPSNMTIDEFLKRVFKKL